MRFASYTRLLRLWLVVIAVLTAVLGVKWLTIGPTPNVLSSSENAHLDISFEEILTSYNKRDSLVFSSIPDNLIPPSARYRIEFTATKAEDYPYRPFDHYHVDGWIVTSPEGVVFSVDLKPASPITYIKGWSSIEREQRTGITPGYTHREGIMHLSLLKKIIFVRNRTKAASLHVTEQWSVDENNIRKRLNTIHQVSQTAPILEHFNLLRALGFLASEKLADPLEQRQEVFLSDGMLKSRYVLQTSGNKKVKVEYDQDWMSLVRKLEVFRQNQQLPSWSVTTEGTLQVGALILPKSGKWITHTLGSDQNRNEVRYETYWQVKIKKAEALPTKPFLEWPEYLGAINAIDDAFNPKEREAMNKRLGME